jgi:hypothetical protein
MTVSATYSEVSRNPRTETRILLLLIWAVAALTLDVTFGTGSLSTDDAMRLVEVRDFLAGQSWFDLTQYRLNPPTGVVTHWSRLIDLPLAVLIKAGAAVLPVALAERIAVAIWPTALLLAYFAGIVRLARDLAGETAARIALIFAALMAPVLQHFRAGAIHHHNVQIVLVIWLLALFARTPVRPRDAAAAGFLCALSVAIGQEMAPAVAVLAIVIALHWVKAGELVARTTVAYACALAAGAIVLGVATMAPAGYLTVHCDAISIAQIGALSLGGFGLAALAAMPQLNSIGRRLAAASCLAALLACAIGLGAPQCLADPYAQLDPRLSSMWLSSVSEARDLSSMMRDLPNEIPAYFGIPLAAVMLGISRCVAERGQRRWNWIACAAVQSAFLLVSLWQIRGASGANALGAALVPAALLQMLPARAGRASYFGMHRAALIAMLLLNPVALLALGNGVARAVGADAVTKQRIISAGATGTCQRARDYAPLARLPRGRVLAVIDSGPFILMQSDDAVLAAPYHRNQAGNLAMLDMFLSALDDAKRLMTAHDIAYVVFCRGAPESYHYAADAPAGLAAALSRGNVPSFLERISLDDTGLIIYRVRR